MSVTIINNLNAITNGSYESFGNRFFGDCLGSGCPSSKQGMGIRAARPGPMFFQPDRDEEVEPDPGPIGLRAEKIEPEPDSG